MNDSRVDEYACLGRWRDEFAALRTILSDTELTEAFKWRKPCYTHAGKNIVIFQPFNDLCALMFFKGALLSDPKALLREQGENSRSSLRLEFRSVADVTSMKSALRDLVADAIRVVRAGLRVKKPTPPTHRDYPDELGALMEADPAFRDAFERLTPGRQRGYLLHFNGAKQTTRRPGSCSNLRTCWRVRGRHGDRCHLLRRATRHRRRPDSETNVLLTAGTRGRMMPYVRVR